MLRIGLVGLCLAAAAGCGDRGSVTFVLKAPQNALFNPVARPDRVSEYDLRTAQGGVIGIASAVQSAGQNLLPLGALMPVGAPEDVYITALSGADVLGIARIRDVTIKAGQKTSYNAELRKPLVFVGSSLPAEKNAGNAVKPAQVLDPIASIDLTMTPGAPPMIRGGYNAGATTWDGRFLVLAQGPQLGGFDTGSGQNVGGAYALPFSPSRLVVSPRDQALVALDPGTAAGDGGFALFNDASTFASAPAMGRPALGSIHGGVGRAAAFSPDGKTLYILTGGPALDPCSPGASLAPNQILSYALDGHMIGTINMTGFISDITIDRDTGTLVLADASAGQVVAMNGEQRVTLLDKLTCPSAVRVVNGTVYAVTSDRYTGANAFTLQRATMKGSALAPLPFSMPSFSIPIDSMPSSNGDIGSATLPVRPVSVWAYELGITPDGNRAEFATRIVYNELGTKFIFSQESCTANFTIVEYGLYAVDLRTGTASYALRAQLPQAPMGGTSCVRCTYPGLPDQFADCPATAGDRPSGIAATFGP